jgi:polysaccharide export outer membrane protein
MSPKLIPLLLALACPLPAAPAQETATPRGDSRNLVANTNSMEVLDDNRRLAVGDLLSYRVVEDRSNTVSSLIVTDSGEVEVPLVGRVHAKGKSCKTVAYELKTLLEKSYYHSATVIIALNFTGYSDIGHGGKSFAATQDQVTIMGAVQQAGRILLPPAETDYTLSQAILDAGGLGRFANAKKVQVVRRTDPDDRARVKRYIINLHNIMKKGRLEEDIVLQPNDVVIVPEKFLNF